MKTSCTISSAAHELPVMRSAKRHIAAWCRRYRRAKASSSPLAARRNKTSSLSSSAIPISPEMAFCAVLSMNSLHEPKKFPPDPNGRRLSLEVFDFTIGWTHFSSSCVSAKKGALLAFGLEHAGGDAGYETARDQAFAMRAEIIPEAGNHVAFFRREGFQSGARNFFRG